jgi:hypothetical protein
MKKILIYENGERFIVSDEISLYPSHPTVKLKEEIDLSSLKDNDEDWKKVKTNLYDKKLIQKAKAKNTEINKLTKRI